MTPSNLEILAYETTPLGDLCLRRRELLSAPGTIVTEIILDQQLLMSSHIVVSERALAEEALARHPGEGLRVLVGGLGLGYTAAAVLESTRVDRVEVIEFIPAVVRFLRDGLIPLSSELLEDPRFDVRDGDVYAALRDDAEERWDLVLIDVDHAPDDHLGAGNESFYTAAGLPRRRITSRPTASSPSGHMRRARPSPRRCTKRSRPSTSWRSRTPTTWWTRSTRTGCSWHDKSPRSCHTRVTLVLSLR